MSVTETLDALGQWSLTLDVNTPKSVLDKIKYFGHIVLDVGQPDVGFLGDSILKTARYVGQLRDKEFKDTEKAIGGSGMLTWMGDADQKGQVFESPLVLTGKTFVQAMTAVIPTCLHVGTLFGTVPGLITTTFQYTDPRTAADYIASTMGAVYRVNGDGTVDGGLVSDLYRTQPVCAVVRNGAGVDMAMRALLGSTDQSSDVEDFTTRVLLLGQGDSGSVADGTADIAGGLNPYLDMFGNAVKLTRMVSESETDATNATARAQLQLNRFSSTRDALAMSTLDYDIKGEIQVGDNLYVYDPITGLINETNEVVFRGERLNPLVLQCTELTWPVIEGMTVAYRDGHGVWTDLTPYIMWESGETTVVVGGYDRSLVSSGEPVGSRPLPDTSIPDVPTWVTPFTESVYQSPSTGQTRAQAQLHWTKPLNTNGTVILDGDHYELQWRQAHTPLFPSTWSQLAGSTYGAINAGGGLWDQPLTYPVGPWQTTVIGWDALTFLLEELLPSHPYEARIRAVDSANPPNFGAWSATTSFQTSDDTIPPSTPAPPVCDSSLIAVQVTHYLGVSTGGTFNLDPDVHHLEVHAQYEPTYTPDTSTMLGKMLVNYGMIAGQIPVVATFSVNGTEGLYFKVIAVDTAGNKSQPSSPVSATPDLIDDAHISDLTATKITAGTISVNILLGGSIKTGLAGARTELDASGIRGYAPDGSQVFNQSNADGSVTIVGSLQTSSSGQRVSINPDPGLDGLPRIDIFDNDATTHATFVAFGGAVLMQRERNSDRSISGGKILWSNEGNILGFQTLGVDWYDWLQSDGQVLQKSSYLPLDAEGGLGRNMVESYVESWTGNSSFSFSYGATMVGIACVVPSVSETTGTWFSSPFNASSTQATVSVQRPSGSASATGRITLWIPRVLT